MSTPTRNFARAHSDRNWAHERSQWAVPIDKTPIGLKTPVQARSKKPLVVGDAWFWRAEKCDVKIVKVDLIEFRVWFQCPNGEIGTKEFEWFRKTMSEK